MEEKGWAILVCALLSLGAAIFLIANLIALWRLLK